MSARILVIDDADNLREMIRFTLEFKGYDIDEAPNGEEALEKLSKDEPYDLILCDIDMPVLDGIGFVRKVRDQDNKDIPILMLTAEDDEYKLKEALKAGATAVLSKPFEPKQLLSEIENYVEI